MNWTDYSEAAKCRGSSWTLGDRLQGAATGNNYDTPPKKIVKKVLLLYAKVQVVVSEEDSFVSKTVERIVYQCMCVIVGDILSK